jgi:hypothetical protein
MICSLKYVVRFSHALTNSVEFRHEKDIKIQSKKNSNRKAQYPSTLQIGPDIKFPGGAVPEI